MDDSHELWYFGTWWIKYIVYSKEWIVLLCCWWTGVWIIQMGLSRRPVAENLLIHFSVVCWTFLPNLPRTPQQCGGNYPFLSAFLEIDCVGTLILVEPHQFKSSNSVTVLSYENWMQANLQFLHEMLYVLSCWEGNKPNVFLQRTSLYKSIAFWSE